MSFFFNCNGKIFKEQSLVLRADNRSFRYGDGLFETLRVSRGKIIRASLHFERLFSDLSILRYNIPQHFTPRFFTDEILNLLQVNKQLLDARVRLVIYGGNGHLYNAEDNAPGYIIQSWVMDDSTGYWNKEGLQVAIYPDAKKACDKYSHIKSNSALPYAMGARFAQENKLNDVILLNSNSRICDSTIANVFIINNKKVYTPPLTEGCVAGTYRKFLLRELPRIGIEVQEKPIASEELMDADEIFLTNAIQQIKWVKRCSGKEFTSEETFRIFSLLQPTI